MRSNKLHSILFIFLLSGYSFADFAWIPDYHHLVLKASGEYLTSNDNYASDGVKTEYLVSGQQRTFNEYKFAIEGEYSFAKDWAGYLKLPFVSGLVDTEQTTVFSGSGVGDLSLGVKWNFLQKRWLITGEVYSNLPLYSNTNLTGDALAIGDGSIDMGGKVHFGYRFNRHLVAGLSPGLVARSAGYQTAFTISAFAGASWHPVYVRFIAENYNSLSKPITTSAVTTNSATGSGGTFARLSQNPDNFSLGGKLGFFAGKRFRVEGSMMWSVLGNYSPAFFKSGINLIGEFDFYEPAPKKTKVKEIPFETEQTPFQETEEE